MESFFLTKEYTSIEILPRHLVDKDEQAPAAFEKRPGANRIRTHKQTQVGRCLSPSAME